MSNPDKSHVIERRRSVGSETSIALTVGNNRNNSCDKIPLGFMVQPIPLRHIPSLSTTHLPAFAINARNMEVVGPYVRSLKGPGYHKVSKSGNSEEYFCEVQTRVYDQEYTWASLGCPRKPVVAVLCKLYCEIHLGTSNVEAGVKDQQPTGLISLASRQQGESVRL